MSYYVTANADIGFAEKLSVEQIKSIESNLEKVFENIRFNPDEILISESHGTYDEIALKEVLVNITNIAKPLKDSHISFRGEDDSLWRFVYNGEDWFKQTGDVIYRKYDEPTYEQLMDMFISYVSQDADGSGDPDYIKDMLDACGCDADLRRAIGLNFEDEEDN